MLKGMACCSNAYVVGLTSLITSVLMSSPSAMEKRVSCRAFSSEIIALSAEEPTHTLVWLHFCSPGREVSRPFIRQPITAGSIRVSYDGRARSKAYDKTYGK